MQKKSAKIYISLAAFGTIFYDHGISENTDLIFYPSRDTISLEKQCNILENIKQNIFHIKLYFPILGSDLQGVTIVSP